MKDLIEGLLIDIVDLSPQFRSVHYKAGTDDDEFTDIFKPRESSISVIASLRSAEAIVYRHNSSSLEIPDIPASIRNDLAYISLQSLDVKVRQGDKILGSVSLGDIEGKINAQELRTLSTTLEQWLGPVNDFALSVQTISTRRLCKSRNLVAAIVRAGEHCGVANDPPFLTRPSPRSANFQECFACQR